LIIILLIEVSSCEYEEPATRTSRVQGLRCHSLRRLVSVRYSRRVARVYAQVREHLDDLVTLAKLVFSRDLVEAAQTKAERDIVIVDLGERIENRLHASFDAGFELPLDRIRTAFQLTATEQRCLELLLALAVSADVRELARSPHGTSTLEQLDRLVYADPS